MTAIDLKAELLAQARRKGQGDNSPGKLMTCTELAREAGVDLTSIRAYLTQGLVADFVNERGTSYFLREALPSHVEVVTHLKATNIATAGKKRSAQMAARRRNASGQLLPETGHITLTPFITEASGLPPEPIETTPAERIARDAAEFRRLHARFGVAEGQVQYDEGGSIPAASIGGEP